MSVGNILNERENNYYFWLSNDLRVMKTALVCVNITLERFTVILIQIVMVSPKLVLGLVSSKIMNPSLQRMSPKSKHNESDTSPKLKMLAGPLCNQTGNLKIGSKILYYSMLKLIYSPSILKPSEG